MFEFLKAKTNGRQKGSLYNGIHSIFQYTHFNTHTYKKIYKIDKKKLLSLFSLTYFCRCRLI